MKKKLIKKAGCVWQVDIRKIFETNKELIGAVDRAVCFFRTGRYDKALEWVADTADEIHLVTDAVMTDREYFSEISVDFIGEMLQNIVEATQRKDYVLLCDLYDMQLATFICGVQEHILKKEQYLLLAANSEAIYKEIGANTAVKKYLNPAGSSTPSTGSGAPDNSGSAGTTIKYSYLIKLTDRGTIKQLLLEAGWPVKDEVALTDGEPLEFNLRETTAEGSSLVIRDYQVNAAKALVGDKGPGTGFGTIVLPCGSGKTIVGMQIMDMLKTSTLIITTNISAVHQWIDELLDKTNLTADQIAEYTGENKDIKPVTVATYQVLTWRPDKEGPFPHFSLFHERPWGLIIYDEVHMLPAPVFRVVAELQAVRRVGLTATLVREDGCEGYVFSLVGPKRYDVPWKELERDNWIASAECVEVRIDLPMSDEIKYAVAGAREKHKIASQNPDKLAVVSQIINKYPEDKILVIGQYLDQLDQIAHLLKAPIITGKTPTAERDRIYGEFRKGNIRVLVVSKVANFAIDLPDASLAIQVSGTFGSRQEEAQRLGRILRPKERTSRFFTLITRNTVEEEFSSNRQKFLAEQGYSYRIVRYGELSNGGETL